MGPSGSGKTTLISMLGGLLQPTSGRVMIDGDEITTLGESRLPRVRAHKIGFVFQAFNLLEALTVEENILFPARLVKGGLGAARARGNALMKRLGLDDRRDALPKTLSGGEKQRVAIARALINAPPVILADEPTGNLDSANGQEVMMILHDIARDEGRAVILVTHDPRVEDIADRMPGCTIRSAECGSTNGPPKSRRHFGIGATSSARNAALTDSTRNPTVT